MVFPLSTFGPLQSILHIVARLFLKTKVTSGLKTNAQNHIALKIKFKILIGLLIQPFLSLSTLPFLLASTSTAFIEVFEHDKHVRTLGPLHLLFLQPQS